MTLASPKPAAPLNHIGQVRVFKLDPSAILPSFGTPQSAGADLVTPYDFTIFSGETVIVDTGLIMQPPPCFRIDIRPRSGLAAKQGITVLNTPGTVDRDYCGPEDTIKIILHKAASSEDSTVPPFTDFSKGDRIAQMVLTRTYHWDWHLETSADFAKVENRGGLGSTDTPSDTETLSE